MTFTEIASKPGGRSETVLAMHSVYGSDLEKAIFARSLVRSCFRLPTDHETIVQKLKLQVSDI